MHYFSGKGCSESLESMHYCIGILKIAKNLKNSGIPIDVIAKNTGLTQEEIAAL